MIPWTGSPPGYSVCGILGKNTGWIAIPLPGDFPDPGIKSASPVSPALRADSLPDEPSGKPS